MWANEIAHKDRELVITHSSYIEGLRTAIPEGWLETNIMDFNASLRDAGYDDIQIVNVLYAKSLMRRKCIFTLKGQAYAVQSFLDAIKRITG